jgi:hypothetical protein
MNFYCGDIFMPPIGNSLSFVGGGGPALPSLNEIQYRLEQAEVQLLQPVIATAELSQIRNRLLEVSSLLTLHEQNNPVPAMQAEINVVRERLRNVIPLWNRINDGFAQLNKRSGAAKVSAKWKVAKKELPADAWGQVLLFLSLAEMSRLRQQNRFLKKIVDDFPVEREFGLLGSNLLNFTKLQLPPTLTLKIGMLMEALTNAPKPWTWGGRKIMPHALAESLCSTFVTTMQRQVNPPAHAVARQPIASFEIEEVKTEAPRKKNGAKRLG